MIRRFRQLHPAARLGLVFVAAALFAGASWFVWWTVSPLFRTLNGPDLFVWLTSGENYEEGVLDLGVLKGNVGSQNYVVPEGTDLAKYDRVIIWCRAFRMLFGTALLES